MRLDRFLAENRLISSRTKANASIKSGLVYVNGVQIRDADWEIHGSEKVEVIDQKQAEMPKGYFKLLNLLIDTHVIDKNDTVLDLGSSAGGYLLAASEIAGKVYGVEISPEFKKEFEKIQKANPKISVKIDNVFKCNIDAVCPERVDVILNDMTLEPLLSFAGLERFLSKLKTGGKVLMTLKLQDLDIEEIESLARQMAHKNNLEVIKFIESNDRKEMFLFAQKLPTKFG